MKKFINKKEIILFICIIIITNIFVLAVQFLKGNLLDSAIEVGNKETVLLGLALLTVILLEIVFTYLGFIVENTIITTSMRGLKQRLFEKITSLQYRFFKSPSTYVAKYTNELTIIENRYFRSITLLTTLLLKVLFVSVALFWLNWQLAIITLFLLTMPLYIPKLAEKQLKNKQNKYLQSNNKFLSFISDLFKGFEIIKNYNIEQIVRQNFNKNNDITTKDYKDNLNKQSQVRTISMLMSYFSHFVVVAYSIFLVYKGVFSVGEVFIAIGLVDQLSYPIIATSGCIQNIISTKSITDELDEYLGDIPALPNFKHQDLKDRIVFDSISFSHDDDQLINDFSLEIKKNGKYLIQGDSGSGKTTLINLLLQYHHVQSGQIYIDDRRITDVDNIFAYVGMSRQDNMIFEDSLRNNLTLYKDIDETKIINVLEEVGLKKYANQVSLDLIIGHNDVSLSGGEAKRISIARAILHKKSVLILDEPLANLDKENVNKIENVILNMKDVTLIVVSHIISDSNKARFDKVINI
jgi:ABC-type multidrug transport system fused ATPase/permease subunit